MSLLDQIEKGKSAISELDEKDTISEGINSALLPELELDKPDEKIIEAFKAFSKRWESLESKLIDRRKNNELAWRNKLSKNGLNSDDPEFWDDDSSDNVIFEAHETWLPAATKTNPEPVVSSPNNNESISRFAKHIKDLIVFESDRDKTKLKMKKAAKYWDLYLTGPLTLEIDEETGNICTRAVRPQNLLLDKNCEIEGGWYKGKMLAERVEDTAEELVEMFPNKKEFIKEMVDDKMGTMVGYYNVWTPEYHCLILKDEVLKKEKNPHFNYTEEKITGYEEEEGVLKDQVEPLNHFKSPRIPYLFISVFNLGKHPVDDTTLFEQCLPYQRSINKRNVQIDENIDGMNGGWIGDNTAFDETTLQDAVVALRSGDAVLAKPGSLTKETGNALDQNVYNDLFDRRDRLKQCYGVTGLSPSGLKGEDTVRGKILTKGSDGDRLSGSVIEVIEQVYDALFNYWVQMIYVYYSEEDIIRILGEEKALEFMGLKEFMKGKELSVSIKDGSLIPKDDLTKRNEAIDLAGMNKIDDISFYKALDHPDPEEMAYKLWLQNNDPMSYFAEFGGRRISGMIQQMQQQQLSQAVPVEQASQENVLNQVPII